MRWMIAGGRAEAQPGMPRDVGRSALWAAAALLALEGAAWAAQGPAAAERVGFEPPGLADPTLLAMSIIKVALLAVFAVAAVTVTHWALADMIVVDTSQTVWGGLVLGAAMAGLAAAILVPVFFIGLPLAIVLMGGAAMAYVKHRNSLVSPNQTVLSRAHTQRLRDRKEARGRALGPVSGVGRDIILMGMDDMPIPVEPKTQEEFLAMAAVQRVLHDSIVRRASAVGFVGRRDRGEIRMRISGEMVEGGSIERPAADQFAAVVRRLAGLDPQETRKPQEGRLRAVVAGQSFEIHIKTAGTVRGEQVAMRIIDLSVAQMRLEQLGLAEPQLDAIKEALAAKPGLVILSSPKDSGLTTTMHACLRHFDRYVNNVIVFEPRVEIEVENVQHIPISQEDGPAAAAEVRSRVRMEPDVVGFDSLVLPEAAQVLADALKEHTVLVGIRAADTSQALARVLALFGSPAPLAERLQMVVNQRLVRLLCPECREAYRPNPEFLRKANLASQMVDVLYRPPSRTPMKDGKPVVCPRCNDGRHIGRTGLFEIMPVVPEMREMIGRGASLADVRTQARKAGMRNLQEEGLQRIIDGQTSVEEVLRAIKQAT